MDRYYYTAILLTVISIDLFSINHIDPGSKYQYQSNSF